MNGGKKNNRGFILTSRAENYQTTTVARLHHTVRRETREKDEIEGYSNGKGSCQMRWRSGKNDERVAERGNSPDQSREKGFRKSNLGVYSIEGNSHSGLEVWKRPGEKRKGGRESLQFKTKTVFSISIQ